MTLQAPPRWRIIDAFFALISGIVAVGIALLFLGDELSATEIFVVVLPVQEAATFGAVWLVSRRRGTGNPIVDFAVRFRRKDGWLILGGVGLQIVLSLLLVLIVDLDESPQEIARLADDAIGVAAGLAFVFTVAFVPFVEELVFRGLLLGALRRKIPTAWAVVFSSAVFTLFHFAGRATLVILPPLFVVGIVLGVLAVRTGRLGPPIMLHSGFNLVPAMVLLFS